MANPGRADEHAMGLGWALGALLALIGSSTLAFMAVEGWSFSEALYFTVLTVTTVGYGDQGLSGAGRWVAQGLMLLGIGLCTYTLALVIHAS